MFRKLKTKVHYVKAYAWDNLNNSYINTLNDKANLHFATLHAKFVIKEMPTVCLRFQSYINLMHIRMSN